MCIRDRVNTSSVVSISSAGVLPCSSVVFVFSIGRASRKTAEGCRLSSRLTREDGLPPQPLAVSIEACSLTDQMDSLTGKQMRFD